MQNKSHAVMAQRTEPSDSQDFFPTPPWATRALMEHVLSKFEDALSGDRKSIREALLVEYYSHENPMPWTANLDYRIVLKGKYKYIRWLRFEDQAELYDLEADPYEQANLIGDPGLARVEQDMRSELDSLALASLGLDGG